MNHLLTTQGEDETSIEPNAPSEENKVVVQEDPTPIDKSIEARKRILNVSLNMFSSHGYDGVSTTQIAKASGVTQPLIHYHFKSKLALWRACVAQVFGWLDDEFIQPIRGFEISQFDKNMDIIIGKFVDFSETRPEFAKFVLSEGAKDTERLEWMIGEYLEPLLSGFETAYKQLVFRGQVKDLPMTHLVCLILGVGAQIYGLKPSFTRLCQADLSAPEEVKAHKAFAIACIRAAVKP